MPQNVGSQIPEFISLMQTEWEVLGGPSINAKRAECGPGAGKREVPLEELSHRVSGVWHRGSNATRKEEKETLSPGKLEPGLGTSEAADEEAGSKL